MYGRQSEKGPANFPGHDLDHADDEHRVVSITGDDVVDPGREVLLPVGEQPGELVQAERDGRDREDGAQQQEGAVRADVGPGLGCGGDHGKCLFLKVAFFRFRLA